MEVMEWSKMMEIVVKGIRIDEVDIFAYYLHSRLSIHALMLFKIWPN